MNKIHENLFTLLIKFDDLCREYGIKYYLAGGSALGALRNNCFLPWDDDLDVYIPSIQWNKLRELVEKDENVIPSGTALVHTGNAEYHRNPIARFVNTETTVVYAAQALSGQTCGLQLEIFILDPMPDGEKEQADFIFNQKVYLELLSPYFIVNKNAGIEEWESHYASYKKYHKQASSRGIKTVLKEFEDRLFSYDEDDCDAYCLRWGIRALIHQKSWYEGERTILLEGREFPVAPLLEHAFRVDYGDNWMYIPDNSTKITHNPILEDLETPFKRYTDQYLPLMNRERTLEAYDKNKFLNMSEYIDRRKIGMDTARVFAMVTGARIKEGLEAGGDDLNDLLLEYHELQLRNDIRRYNVLIDIGEENFYKVILNDITQGEYFTADKLLRIREAQGEPLSEELEACKGYIEPLRALSIATYDDKDAEEAESALKECGEKNVKAVDCDRAELWLMEQRAESEQDWKDIEARGKKSLETYPFDGELMAYVAAAQLNLGKPDLAKETYDDAVHNTRNGFVWNRAKKDVGIDRMSEEVYVED